MYQKNEKNYKIYVIIALLKKEDFNVNCDEKILKEINTPEGQERIKKWAEKYLAKENARNIKMQEMLSNTDYIKWLDKFTIEYSSFSDNDWLYFPEKISKEDLEKVNNLHLMYRGIEKYASENYICPTDCNFGNFYGRNFANNSCNNITSGYRQIRSLSCNLGIYERYRGNYYNYAA